MAPIPLTTLEPKPDHSLNAEQSVAKVSNADDLEAGRDAKEPLLESDEEESVHEDILGAKWTLRKSKGWRRPAVR